MRAVVQQPVAASREAAKRRRADGSHDISDAAVGLSTRMAAWLGLDDGRTPGAADVPPEQLPGEPAAAAQGQPADNAKVVRQRYVRVQTLRVSAMEVSRPRRRGGRAAADFSPRSNTNGRFLHAPQGLRDAELSHLLATWQHAARSGQAGGAPAAPLSSAAPQAQPAAATATAPASTPSQPQLQYQVRRKRPLSSLLTASDPQAASAEAATSDAQDGSGAAAEQRPHQGSDASRTAGAGAAEPGAASSLAPAPAPDQAGQQWKLVDVHAVRQRQAGGEPDEGGHRHKRRATQRQGDGGGAALAFAPPAAAAAAAPPPASGAEVEAALFAHFAPMVRVGARV